MNSEYKQKLLENAPIYVDCNQLLKCVYRLLFTMPKKDRVIVGDKIIEYNMSMIAHFSRSYQFKEERLKETDLFLFDYDRLKALLRMSCDLKIILQDKYALLFIYLKRIDEGVAKWRNSALGCFKNRNEYKRCTLFKRAVLDKFVKVLEWNEKKNAFKIKK